MGKKQKMNESKEKEKMEETRKQTEEIKLIGKKKNRQKVKKN